MKKILLISLFHLFISISFAQKIKVISSTSQTWAGGQCCSYGINYKIVLESTDTTSLFRFDTVWIDKQSYVKGTARTLTINETIKNGKRYFTIESNGTWNRRDVFDLDMPPDKPEKILAYNGKACIVYHVGEVRCIEEIKKFEVLYPIAYP